MTTFHDFYEILKKSSDLKKVSFIFVPKQSQIDFKFLTKLIRNLFFPSLDG